MERFFSSFRRTFLDRSLELLWPKEDLSLESLAYFVIQSALLSNVARKTFRIENSNWQMTSPIDELLVQSLSGGTKNRLFGFSERELLSVLLSV